MLQKLAPEKIYPIHTDHPKHLKGKFQQVQTIETGNVYKL
jgi:hypothetical protein